MPRPAYTVSIEEAVRNLCLGRVLLKANAAAGDDEVPVGDEFAAPDSGASVVGTMLWHNNSLNIVDKDKAYVVQPTAADVPDGIEHQEQVTIDTTALGTNNLHLHITDVGGLDNSYTVARGAYARLSDLPTVCGGLRLVQDDFLTLGVEPFDKWFPGILVYGIRADRESLSVTQWMDTYVIVVRYAMLMDEGWSRQDTRDAILGLTDILTEDPRLGGSCVDSKIIHPIQLASTPGQIDRGGTLGDIKTRTGKFIDWGDIHLTAWRIAAIDKTV